MSYPPPTPPPPGFPPAGGAGAAAGNDKSQLLGIIGIVAAICCPLAGIVLGVISLMQANKYGSNKMWGIIAIVLAVVVGVLGTIVNLTVLNNQ